MRIAVALYGQPRDYMKGYNNIMAFINKHNDCTFDFFYHCWSLNENQSYKHSPWRDINKDSLIFREEILTHLQELYNPISCEIQNQNLITFDESLYNDTIAFNNTKGIRISNINNTLFQMYSQNKVRNLVDAYLTKMDNSVHYDFVILTRYDVGVMPDIDLTAMDTSDTYVSDILFPRKIIPQACIITSMKMFVEWFNIYDALNDILDNKDIAEYMSSLNECLQINPEELVFAKYLFHYKIPVNIHYFNGGNL